MPRIGRVKLLKKIKLNDKWVFAPALFDSKGRVRRDHVTIDGADALHPEGGYFLQWWNAGVRTHEAVGPDAFVAAERARKKQAELSAVRSGVIDATPAIEHPDRVTVKTPSTNTRITSATTARCGPSAPTAPFSAPSQNSVRTPTSTRSTARRCSTTPRCASRPGRTARPSTTSWSSFRR